MHYTEPVYRNPYVKPSPLLEITQGCTHNRCKFCVMYKGVQFRPSPIEWIEEDLQEIASIYPDTTELQFLGADPFALSFEKLDKILDLVHKYLPKVNRITMAARVSNVANKTVDQLKILREKGITELYIGVESGDDWTLDRINKGYKTEDILEQTRKLDEAGIKYWMTFLNGVAGKEHSKEHAINSAKIFSQANPIIVGSGGLTLFPDTELAKEMNEGTFTPLTEKEMLEEYRTFLEHLDTDATLITHHTLLGINLTGMDFLPNKERILEALDREIENMNEEYIAQIRSGKEHL